MPFLAALGPITNGPREGASEEVAKAMAANEAAMRDVLQLRHLSLASSGLGDQETDVDPEYTCPICLVCASTFLMQAVLGFVP